MKGFDLGAILGNPEYVGMLLHGIEMTFIIAIGSWLLAMSLAIVIGAPELSHAVKEIENLSFRTFEIYLVGTVLYLFFSLIIMGFGAYLTWRADPAHGGR